MIIFMDGFDGYGPTLGLNWDSPGNFTIQSTTARQNGASKDLGGPFEIPKACTNGTSQASKGLPGNFTSLIVGGAVRVSNWVNLQLFGFFDLASQNQCDVRLMGNGTIGIYRANVLQTSGTVQIPTGQFHYLEFKYASGTATVHVDGVDIGLSASFSLPFSNNGSITRVSLPAFNAALSVIVDDFYIADTTGSVNNDFLGDIIIPTVLATASGSFTQWDIKPASSKPTNWQNINENPPDGDTTYVYSSTSNQRDSYIFGTDPLVNGILAVGVQGEMETDVGGSRIIQLSARQSGVDKFSPNLTVGSQSYSYFDWIAETDVNNNPWTPTNFNTTEFGMKLIS